MSRRRVTVTHAFSITFFVYFLWIGEKVQLKFWIFIKVMSRERMGTRKKGRDPINRNFRLLWYLLWSKSKSRRDLSTSTCVQSRSTLCCFISMHRSLGVSIYIIQMDDIQDGNLWGLASVVKYCCACIYTNILYNITFIYFTQNTRRKTCLSVL